MDSLLSALALPAAASAVSLTRAVVTSASQPFAALLTAVGESLATGSPAANSVSLSEVRGEQVDVAELVQAEVGHRLGVLLDRRHVVADPPIRLRVGRDDQRILVESDHPQAAWLENEIAGDAQLDAGIRQLAFSSRQEPTGETWFAWDQTAEVLVTSLGGAVELRWL